MKVMDVSDSESSKPLLGKVVRITRGRDAGKYAIVVQQLDDKYVAIADGDKRKLDRPKRKNIIHLDVTDYTVTDVIKPQTNNGRLTNGKLRYHLGKYIEQQTEVQRKGE